MAHSHESTQPPTPLSLCPRKIKSSRGCYVIVKHPNLTLFQKGGAMGRGEGGNNSGRSFHIRQVGLRSLRWTRGEVELVHEGSSFMWLKDKQRKLNIIECTHNKGLMLGEMTPMGWWRTYSSRAQKKAKVEGQQESYLDGYKNSSLSEMLTVVVKQFLPDSYRKVPCQWQLKSKRWNCPWKTISNQEKERNEEEGSCMFHYSNTRRSQENCNCNYTTKEVWEKTASLQQTVWKACWDDAEDIQSACSSATSTCTCIHATTPL